MAGYLEVDTGGTRATTQGLRGAGTRIRDAVQNLESRLAAVGPCWGESDDVAKAFQKSYAPAAQNLVKAARDIGTVLDGTAGQVDQMMHGYAEVEASAASASSPD